MHRLSEQQVTHAWDRNATPAVTVAPGDTVELAVRDAADGQLSPDSTAEDVAALDPQRANPITGPVHVEGVAPGDALVVHIEAVEVFDWGWTAVIPEFGLLAEDFPDPHLVVSAIGPDRVSFGHTGLQLPRRPFIGTIGLAPAGPWPHPTIPPLRTGGNLDCRDVRPGAVLRLPVESGGGLLSVGDTHAVQGDGEVCGTAVETPATVVVRIEVEQDAALPGPQLTTPAARRPRPACHATMGVGPDLYRAAQDATRAMITWLTTHHGLAPVDAYLLCSVVADLRIREVVNAPDWVVSMDLPLDVLA